MAALLGKACAEPIRQVLIGPEEIMEHLQALICIECRQVGGQLSKARLHFRAHTGEIAAGFLDVAFGNGYGQGLILGQIVARRHGTVQQHAVVFVAVLAEVIVPFRDQHRFLKVAAVDTPVVQRDLRRCGCVQRIDQLAVLQEHGCLIVLGGNGIVDIRKGETLGKLVTGTKHAVRIDFIDGYPALHGARHHKALAVIAGKPF